MDGRKIVAGVARLHVAMIAQELAPDRQLVVQ
jgi:hypothetical protein